MTFVYVPAVSVSCDTHHMTHNTCRSGGILVHEAGRGGGGASLYTTREGGVHVHKEIEVYSMTRILVDFL